MSDIMIPKAAPEKPSTRMKRGANLAMITKVEQTMAKNGHPKSNKNGDKGIDVTFQTKEKAEFTETFWLAANTQWRLDTLLKAAKIDNSKGAVKSSALLKQKIWLVLQEELHLEGGKQKMSAPDKNGKSWPVSYFKVLEFKEYIQGAEAPAYADDKLVTTKEVGTSTGPAKAAPSFDSSSEKESKPAETEEWETGGGDAATAEGDDYPSEWDDTDAKV